MGTAEQDNSVSGTTNHSGKASAEDLPQLVCPGCGAPLETRAEPRRGPGGLYAVVGCECSEYPVVADIPIIMGGRAAEALVPMRALCRKIRSGEYDEALSAATGLTRARQQRSAQRSGRPARWRRLRERFLPSVFDEQHSDPPSGWLDLPARSMLQLRFPGTDDLDREVLTYFSYRPAHAEQFAAMGLASLITPQDGPVLDIGTGAGHMAAHLTARGIPVCGVDRDFFLLLIARRTVAPAGNFVCCDLEEGLPFQAASFGAATCINILHFIRAKTDLAAALAIVLRKGSPLTISGLRHSGNPGAFRNFALPPQGYARVFESFSPAFFSTEEVVDRYIAGRTPERDDKREPKDLLNASFLEMAGHKGGSELDFGAAFNAWPHAAGRLDINPLYRQAGPASGEKTLFQRIAPSDQFMQDSGHLVERLPLEAEIDTATLKALSEGRRVETMDDLIRKMILIGLPPGYAHLDGFSAKA